MIRTRNQVTGEKWIRPMSLRGDRYVLASRDSITARLSTVWTSSASRREETVVVCEGEKCADALRNLGVLAITSGAGGARAALKSDWQPLARRKVLIWPDHDEPGIAYAQTVLQEFRAP